MPRTRSQKAEIIAKAIETLKSAASTVFVSFTKLTVKEIDQLRKLEREADSRFLVIKKTLLSRALAEVTPNGVAPELPGEVGIAYGNDPLAPAKSIAQFRQGKETKVNILGGIFEGRFMNAIEMTELANIPSRETLLGMLVNVINSPISGLVVAFDAIAKKRR